MFNTTTVRLSKTLQAFMKKNLGTSPMYVPLVLSLVIVVVLLLVVLCQRDSLNKKKKGRRKNSGNNNISPTNSNNNNNNNNNNINNSRSNNEKGGSSSSSNSSKNNDNNEVKSESTSTISVANETKSSSAASASSSQHGNDPLLIEMQNLLVEKLQEMDEEKNDGWKDITSTVSDVSENDVIKEIEINGKPLFQFQLNVDVSVDDLVGFFWHTAKQPGKAVKGFKVFDRPNGNPNNACRMYHQMYPSFGNQVLSLSERDLVSAEALFELDGGRIAYVAKSIDETAEITPQLLKFDKVKPVRVDLPFSIYIFENKGPNKCLVTRYVNLDYKLPWWIPSSTLRKEQTKRPIKSMKRIEQYINSDKFTKVKKLPLKYKLDGSSVSNLPNAEISSGNSQNKVKSQNKDINKLMKEVEAIDHDAENAQTNMYLALGLTAITCVLYVIRR